MRGSECLSAPSRRPGAPVTGASAPGMPLLKPAVSMRCATAEGCTPCSCSNDLTSCRCLVVQERRGCARGSCPDEAALRADIPMLLKLRTADPPAKHAKPVVLPPDNLYAASLLESSTAAGASDTGVPCSHAWQPGPGAPGTVRCSSEPTALAASAPARPAAGLARAGSAAPETPVSRSVQQYEQRCGALAQAPGRSPRAAVRRSCSAGAEPGSAAPQAPAAGAAPARRVGRCLQRQRRVHRPAAASA